MKKLSMFVLILMLLTFQNAFCDEDMPEEVTFNVSVVDNSGAIIPNVGIQVIGPAKGGGIAPEGKFIFKDYPQGTYEITAQGKDYHASRVSVEVKPGMKPVIITLSKKVIAAEPVVTKVDFAVLVVDEKGAPVSGADIELSGPVSGGGVTPSGQANFRGFPEGSYELKVSEKDHISEKMVLKVSKDMGSQIGGMTGVTILLGKKKEEKTEFQPSQGAVVGSRE